MGFYANRVLPHLIHQAMRNPELAPYRTRVLSAAQGRVLEVGIGSGANLPLYPENAVQILGLDPHPKLLAMARRKGADHFLPVEGSAEQIPLDDSTIDTVVLTWTLCSIPDPSRALREMRRVLRRGGQLLFVEHGLAPEQNVRRWQKRLTPLWKRIGGGCHLDRPISSMLTDAGFELARVNTGYMKGPRPMTFMYEGQAFSR